MDFGGLGALTGVNPWQEIRAERAQDTQRIALLDAMQQQKLAQQQEGALFMQQQLDSVKNLKVLEQDKSAIQDKSKELQKTLLEGVKKYNGNVSKYLNSGGKLELYKYQQNLVNSEEVQRGLLNAYNHAQYIQDLQKGLTPRQTQWDGGQGEYAQNYKDFVGGKTKALNYQGAYQRPDLGDLRKSFSEVYGKDRYTRQEVDPATLFQKVLIEGKNKGLSEQDAVDNAKKVLTEYAATLKSGAEPYTFKTDDVQKLMHQRKMEDLGYANLMLKAKKAEANTENPYNDFYSGDFGSRDVAGQFHTQQVNAPAYLQQFGSQPPQGMPADQKIEIPVSVTQVSSEDAKKNIAQSLYGLKYDKKKGGWEGQLPSGQVLSDVNLMPFPTDLNELPFTVVDILGTKTIKSPDGQGLKPYTIMKVKFPSQSMLGGGRFAGLGKGLGATNSHWWWPDSETAASQGKVDWENDAVTLLVPTPTPQENGLAIREFNYKMRNNDKPKYGFEGDEYLGEPVSSDEE